MKRTILLIALLANTVCTVNAVAQDVFAEWRQSWLQKAEDAKPQLKQTIARPVAVVKATKDETAFQGWRYVATGEDPKAFTGGSFKSVKDITLDFGKHLTGYFSFHTKTLARCQDAPIRLKLTFGELPAEMNTPLDPWKGYLSRAWMQDIIIDVPELDKVVTLDRRLAFRYLRIELLGTPADCDWGIDDVWFTAVSSADAVRTELQTDCPDMMRRIFNVGTETLHECMQTVYEDGPKRDQRLWAGDMYLESLANRYSFQNWDLTKRCLYLFAALSNDEGIVMGNCFEKPEPHPQYGCYCLTYSLLWNSTLLEYLRDTNDRATAEDLWRVAKRQMEDALTYVDSDYIFDQHKRGQWVWLFFDWREGLDVNTPMQGATIFALKQTYELARMLGKEKEVSQWQTIARKMSQAALRKLYDAKRGVFVSGADSQVSVLSQTWLIKAGVITGKQAQKAIRTALAHQSTPFADGKQTVMPGTPYGTHYLIEAMVNAGMNTEARQYLEQYWGGMVSKGADTFWEAYDPDDDYLTPYHFFPLNSACHAWSCTPVYFIMKYPEIFQQ